MKEKKLFDAITNLPDEIIEEAAESVKKKSVFIFNRYMKIACCFVLLIGIAVGCYVYKTGYDEYKRNLHDIKTDPENFEKIQYLVDGKVNTDDITKNNVKGALVNVSYPQSISFEDSLLRKEVMQNNPVEYYFYEGLNNFAVKTGIEVLKNSQGNVNYSPMSLYYSLALLSEGAKGETKEEILSLLGVSEEADISLQCRNFYRHIFTNNQVSKLKIANSLWINDEIDVKEDFAENAAENFFASCYKVDFSENNTKKMMAEWIKENTCKTIDPNVQINSEQILSILNTIYFYDEWQNRFSEESTKRDTFYLDDKKTIQCNFMNSSRLDSFTKGKGYTAASLTMKNSSRMVFILPDKNVSVKELLSDSKELEKAFLQEEDHYGKVTWKIPKFSFGSKFYLADTLKKLGISKIFDLNADFSNITDSDAYFDEVVQETYISVNERGVEASAYTDIMLVGSALPEETAEMILDRPFIYGIISDSNTILFMGICENPAEQ